MKIKIETPSCETCAARLSNVFCTLTDDQAHDMSIDKSSSHYRKGQLIFFEGNRPSGLYCIRKGKIKVYQIGSGNREQIIRLAKEGDILGYRSLISGEVYNASAEAIEDSEICFINRKSFFDLLQENSDLSTKVMQLLSHDLKSAESRMTGLAQKPVRERLAETLLTLKEFYGHEQDNATINATLTREDIANIVGTATETAIRLLSDFKNEKIIELVGKKIKILNHEKLVKIANVYN
jgi:CRP-like cAMP-binding protein